MAANNGISKEENERLGILRQKLFANAEFWNEEELKMMFIGPLIELVEIESENFRTFYDRSINVIVNNIPLSGNLDMVVATGFQIPKKPFFCVHEYKQERNAARSKRDNDPKGQLLSEMKALQAINESDNPIYGCYVLGRNWFLVVLIDNKYAVSKALDSTEDEIFTIFKMLKKIKDYIIEMTN